MSVRAKIVIVGGGPAGAAAAIQLAQGGCHAMLLEMQAAPRWKIGETLPPEAYLFLQRLGHWKRFQGENHLPCHGVVSVWGQAAPIEKDFIFNPCGHAWQLDRVAFESGLLNAAEDAGGDVRFDVSVQRIERQKGRWVLYTSSGTLHADWIVDCTGRASTVRKGIIAPEEKGEYTQLDRLVSVFGTAVSDTQTDCDSRTYVEAQSEGWFYTALTPSRARTIAFQTDADLVPNDMPLEDWFRLRLAASTQIAQLLNKHEYRLTGGPHCVATHSGHFQRYLGRNWVAVGDAAMTFDPLSGQGSAKALKSAWYAAHAILQGFDYQEACEQLWLDFARQRQEFYLAECRWSDYPFWRRRHAGASH